MVNEVEVIGFVVHAWGDKGGVIWGWVWCRYTVSLEKPAEFNVTGFIMFLPRMKCNIRQEQKKGQM